nr:MerR family transcriptional regulator [Oscillospiraceae bacterium]
MKSVKEIASQTGVSIRTLHHYDAIGLLKPSFVAESGYRYYDEAALERLYLILIFREIGFPLKKIKDILAAPDYDRNRILEQQIALLEKKRDRLEYMANMARGIMLVGIKYLEFGGFDVNKMDEYAAQAKTLYGKTEAYQEYEQKARSRTPETNKAVNDQVMDFFVRLGQLKDLPPESPEVQAWVKDLQSFFTEHFYTCTPQILKGLGELYAGGGSMTENIDAAGGTGTGEFAREAIEIYCK